MHTTNNRTLSSPLPETFVSELTGNLDTNTLLWQICAGAGNERRTMDFAGQSGGLAAVHILRYLSWQLLPHKKVDGQPIGGSQRDLIDLCRQDETLLFFTTSQPRMSQESKRFFDALEAHSAALPYSEDGLNRCDGLTVITIMGRHAPVLNSFVCDLNFPLQRVAGQLSIRQGWSAELPLDSPLQDWERPVSSTTVAEDDETNEKRKRFSVRILFRELQGRDASTARPESLSPSAKAEKAVYQAWGAEDLWNKRTKSQQTSNIKKRRP